MALSGGHGGYTHRFRDAAGVEEAWADLQQLPIPLVESPMLAKRGTAEGVLAEDVMIAVNQLGLSGCGKGFGVPLGCTIALGCTAVLGLGNGVKRLLAAALALVS